MICNDSDPDVLSIFPPDEDCDLTEFAPIVQAQQDIATVAPGSHPNAHEEVNVVIDDQVDDQVVELLGMHANLGFALDEMDLPYLVCQLKNMNRYFRFELVVTDKKGVEYYISASNNQSAVRSKKTSCSVPIVLTPGWNRICLDLRDICKRAFGAQYHMTKLIRVYANCRIWRLFFQDQDYPDQCLPLHLRVVDG